MNKKLDIITIGESIIELSSEESLANAEHLDKFYGGDTICAAIAALRMGAKVGYITRIGNDFFKEFLLDNWQTEGIDISHVKLDKGFNGVYFIGKSVDGSKEFSYYRKKTAATNLSIEDIDENYIKQARLVYSSGITENLSLSAKEAVNKAFSLAKANEIQVAYDVKYVKDLWDKDEAKEAFEEIADFIDIIFLTLETDGKVVFGIDSAENLIKHLWDKGISIVVVKCKEGNCYLIGYNGEIKKINYYTLEVKDTTGAGSTFNGAFLAAYLNGYSVFESGQFAMIAAGLQTQKVGAVKSIPSKKEVEALI